MLLKHLLPLLAITIATPVLADKGYHLWYDEFGEPVYSQFAPGEGRRSEVVNPPPPPPEPAGVAQRRLQQQLQTFEDNREDQAIAAEKAAAANNEARVKRQRCEAARKNLVLLNGPPRLLFQTADGVRRLTPEERDAKRDGMQKIVDAECQ